MRKLDDDSGKLSNKAIAAAVADISGPDLLVTDRQLAIGALVEAVRSIAYEEGYAYGAESAYEDAAQAYSGYEDGYSDGYDAAVAEYGS